MSERGTREKKTKGGEGEKKTKGNGDTTKHSKTAEKLNADMNFKAERNVNVECACNNAILLVFPRQE